MSGFIAEGLPTPGAVADAIIGRDEFYYFTDNEGKRRVARCQYKSREDIVRYYEREIRNSQDLCSQVFTDKGWEKKCLPAAQVQKNLQAVFESTLKEWDSGVIRPDPRAKAKVAEMWKAEAEKVKSEGRLVIETIKFEITPRGLEPKGRELKGPEKW